MSNEQPPPRPISDPAQFESFILGLLIFGVFGMIMFFVPAMFFVGPNGDPFGIVGLAVVMVLLTGGFAIWAMRSGKIALGSGFLVGYAIAAVASGGQCTFLSMPSDYGPMGVMILLAGVVGIAFVIGGIAAILSKVIANWRRRSQ